MNQEKILKYFLTIVVVGVVIYGLYGFVKLITDIKSAVEK